VHKQATCSHSCQQDSSHTVTVTVHVQHSKLHTYLQAPDVLVQLMLVYIPPAPAAACPASACVEIGSAKFSASQSTDQAQDSTTNTAFTLGQRQSPTAECCRACWMLPSGGLGLTAPLQHQGHSTIRKVSFAQRATDARPGLLVCSIHHLPGCRVHTGAAAICYTGVCTNAVSFAIHTTSTHTSGQ
jgi:hypothetical protein